MTPPAPLQLPTSDEALGWVRDRTSNGLANARELDSITHEVDNLATRVMEHHLERRLRSVGLLE